MSSILILKPKSNNKRRALRLYHEAVGPFTPGGNSTVFPVQGSVTGTTEVPIGSGGGLIVVPYTVTWSPEAGVDDVIVDVNIWFRLTSTILVSVRNDMPFGVFNTGAGAAQDYVQILSIHGDSLVARPLEYTDYRVNTGRARNIVPNTGTFNGELTIKASSYSTIDIDDVKMQLTFYDNSLIIPLS